MSAVSNKSLVQEGDWIVLKKENFLRTIQVRSNRQVWIEKSKFVFDNIIGKPYGLQYEVKNGKLEKVIIESQASSSSGAAEVTGDNRDLLDHESNQKLSRDEIEAMRQKGLHGKEIIDKLVENSQTFDSKTEFSKEKYIKKKKQKHLTVFRVLKPNSRLLCEMYTIKGKSKICNMRVDTLAQILTLSNIRANSKAIVVETCAGLILGAVMERLGEDGKIVELFHGTAPVRPEALHYSKDYYNEHIVSLRLNMVADIFKKDDATNGTVDESVKKSKSSDDASSEVSEAHKDIEMPDSTVVSSTSLSTCVPSSTSNEMEIDSTSDNTGTNQKRPLDEMSEGDKRRLYREQRIKQAMDFIKPGNMDTLIVASKFHPTPIVLSLIGLLAPSRPFAVYCQYKEPLMDCYSKLRERGGIINLRMTESWFREYQVLPKRTHPHVMMSGTGGYLLTGTTISLND